MIGYAIIGTAIGLLVGVATIRCMKAASDEDDQLEELYREYYKNKEEEK